MTEFIELGTYIIKIDQIRTIEKRSDGLIIKLIDGTELDIINQKGESTYWDITVAKLCNKDPQSKIGFNQNDK